ncbi:MAG: hypothetical protein U0Q16_17625 [Bryobacteraceae bacterium]
MKDSTEGALADSRLGAEPSGTEVVRGMKPAPHRGQGSVTGV